MTSETSVREFAGLDSLREWLVQQGFRVAPNGLRGYHNECDWYAYRRSEGQARECEANGGKSMQLVVTPTRFGAWEGVEIDVTGEAGGVWFKLMAYSLKPDEVQARVPDVERSLIAAWNALR